jgi:ribosome-binding ATPase YchF (GTP1/OBG family)
MKRLVLFILLLSPFMGMAQEKLNRLVQERQSLHQQWRQSESKQSGIFGNRTKKDMIETNNWMERIIQKDNQIIEELQVIKERELVEVSYEKDDYKYISQKQEQDIGKLKRALAETESRIGEEKSHQRTYEWISFIFFLSTVTLGILYYKKVSK